MIGMYVLLLQADVCGGVQVGKRLIINVEKGFYGYVGSALAGLEQRLARHTRKQKKNYWHIDYLVERATVRAIVYAESSEKKECLIAHALATRLSSVSGFGCSDCHCRSHLFFSTDFSILKSDVLTAFEEQALIPRYAAITPDPA